jgi:hypothetical protein
MQSVKKKSFFVFVKKEIKQKESEKFSSPITLVQNLFDRLARHFSLFNY